MSANELAPQLANLLSRVRWYLRLTNVAKVARETGSDITTLYKLRNGKTHPNFETLEILCQYIDQHPEPEPSIYHPKHLRNLEAVPLESL